MLVASPARAGECLTEHPRLCGGRLSTARPICADPDLGLIYEWVHAIEDALTEQGALIGGDSPRDVLYGAAREWVIAYAKMTLDQRHGALKWGNADLCGGPMVDAGPVCTDAPGPVLARVTAWVHGVGEAMDDAGWDGTIHSPTDRLRRASRGFEVAVQSLTPEQIAAFDADCAMKVRAPAAGAWPGGPGLLTSSEGGWTLTAGDASWPVRHDGDRWLVEDRELRISRDRVEEGQ